MSDRSRTPPALDPSAVRGVIFDLDGTLVDSYGAIAASANHARRHFGLPTLVEGEVRRRVGRGLESLLGEILGVERVTVGVRLFREHYGRVYAGQTVALPGVSKGLEALADRGLAMAVASNKPARFGEPILAQLDLLRFFSCVEGPDRCGATKPDPVMLRCCLRSLALQPAQALYVGDMVLDVESATAADLPVVLIRGGSSTADELHATGQPVLGSLPELARLLTSAARTG